MTRLNQICAYESISYDSSGLEALIFTAEGDLRTALNGLQATVSGFGHVTSVNVFKVCDQPHPLKLKATIEKCVLCFDALILIFMHRCRHGEVKAAVDVILELWGSGYAATDIIQTLFRVMSYGHYCCINAFQVTKSYDMPEPQKLLFLREIGFTHMRISEGLNTQLQLLGCVSRLASLKDC